MFRQKHAILGNVMNQIPLPDNQYHSKIVKVIQTKSKPR